MSRPNQDTELSAESRRKRQVELCLKSIGDPSPATAPLSVTDPLYEYARKVMQQSLCVQEDYRVLVKKLSDGTKAPS